MKNSFQIWLAIEMIEIYKREGKELSDKETFEEIVEKLFNRNQELEKKLLNINHVLTNHLYRCHEPIDIQELQDIIKDEQVDKLSDWYEEKIDNLEKQSKIKESNGS